MHTDREHKLHRDIHLLSKSILKWERLASNSASSDSIDDCALCTEYYKSRSSGLESCVGCPIRDNTSKQFCKGTPYDAWAKSLSDKFNMPIESIHDIRCKSHAESMHRYLCDLQEDLINKAKQIKTSSHAPSNIPRATSAIHL